MTTLEILKLVADCDQSDIAALIGGRARQPMVSKWLKTSVIPPWAEESIRANRVLFLLWKASKSASGDRELLVSEAIAETMLQIRESRASFNKKKQAQEKEQFDSIRKAMKKP